MKKINKNDISNEKEGNSFFGFLFYNNLLNSKRSDSRLLLDNKINIFPKNNRSGSHFDLDCKFNLFPKSKRSQLTLFILIGIIIVIAIPALFIIQKNFSNEEKITPDVLPIYSFIQNCIKDSGENAVYFIGQTGGYNLNLFSSNNETQYYFFQGKNYMPSKEKIENEISSYVNNMLDFCTNKFRNFPDFKIEEGVIISNTTIENNKVVLNVVYPLRISKNNKVYSVKNFEGIEIPVRLGLIYNLAYNMTEWQVKNPDAICFSCIINQAVNNSLRVEINEYDKEKTIFTIVDEQSKIKGEDYRFIFVNKYGALQ